MIEGTFNRPPPPLNKKIIILFTKKKKEKKRVLYYCFGFFFLIKLLFLLKKKERRVKSLPQSFFSYPYKITGEGPQIVLFGTPKNDRLLGFIIYCHSLLSGGLF
jgi:hypothetical protein